jgi:hypothetical protein
LEVAPRRWAFFIALAFFTRIFMKIFTGNTNNLPERVNDPKGETFDEDVYVDTETGFRVLGTEGETVAKDYHKAVLAGCKESGKPKPTENKGGKPATENK